MRALFISVVLAATFPAHAIQPDDSQPTNTQDIGQASDTTARHAEESPTVKADYVLGSIYGKKITAADIELTTPVDTSVEFDVRNTTEWNRMGRIMTAFGKPILDRFSKEHKIEVTEEEIRAYRNYSKKQNGQNLRESESRRTQVAAKLTEANISDEAKAKLQTEQTQIDTHLSILRDKQRKEIPDELIRHFIAAWKLESALHSVYGGRAIFQQFGPEALDARRLLFEQAEKQGDLKFEDAGVRHLFYYYYKMKHMSADEASLKKPRFLGE